MKSEKKKTFPLFVILVLAALLAGSVLTACENEPAPIAESSETESVTTESKEESTEISEESTPVAEPVVEGIWRAVTNVSPALREQWENVCPELPLGDTEISIPVIVDIKESMITVTFDRVELALYDALLDKMPGYIETVWGGKTGDKTLEEFIEYGGITPGGLLETFLLRMDFSDIELPIEKDKDKLKLTNGAFAYRFEGEQLVLSAENFYTGPQLMLKDLFPQTFSRVEIEKEEVVGESVLRYYWDGKDDLTVITHSPGGSEVRKRLIGKKVVSEETRTFDENGELLMIDTTDSFPDRKYKLNTFIHYYREEGSETHYEKGVSLFNTDGGTNVEWSSRMVEDLTGWLFTTGIDATVDGKKGERRFIFCPEMPNGACFECGFYSENSEYIKNTFYDVKRNYLGSATIDGTHMQVTHIRDGKEFRMETKDARTYVITDQKKNLVIKFELLANEQGQTTLNVKEIGSVYQDDMTEVQAIFNLFFM